MTRDEVRRRLTCARSQGDARSGQRGWLRGDEGATGTSPEPTPAAVLVGLVDRPKGPTLLLTQRTEHLRDHAGQISFPGGRIEPDDGTTAAAALREAEEEIGLLADQVEMLGPIEPYETGTGFWVTPFVGLVAARFRPLPDPEEVAEIFEAPLAHLVDPAFRERRSRPYLGAERAYWAIPYEGRDIWGATAGMLKALSDRIIAVVAE